MVGLLVRVGGILSSPYSFKDEQDLRSRSYFFGFWEWWKNQDVFSIIEFLESEDNMDSYLAVARDFPKLRSPGPTNAEFPKISLDSKEEVV